MTVRPPHPQNLTATLPTVRMIIDVSAPSPAQHSNKRLTRVQTVHLCQLHQNMPSSLRWSWRRHCFCFNVNFTLLGTLVLNFNFMVQGSVLQNLVSFCGIYRYRVWISIGYDSAQQARICSLLTHACCAFIHTNVNVSLA